MQAQEGKLSELCRFWIDKGLSVEFLRKLVNCGLTDDIIRCLEKKGLLNVEIAFVRQCLDVDSDSFCDCSNSSSICTSDSEDSENRRSEVSAYLKEHLGHILPKILRDVFFENPSDPVEYIGRYLLYYSELQERKLKSEEFQLELAKKREEFANAQN